MHALLIYLLFLHVVAEVCSLSIVKLITNATDKATAIHRSKLSRLEGKLASSNKSNAKYRTPE